MQGSYNVLFICTGNRARSILAEAILNHKGGLNFTAFSAGSHPHGEVHPFALRTLADAGISIHGLRSKSWEEFALPGAPKMDFVFTLCDTAAREMCPVWPGQPMTAHWGLRDPGDAGGNVTELERMFREAFIILDRRISLFLSLPLSSLDKLAIKKEIDGIGLQ
jgi:arsenate reductase